MNDAPRGQKYADAGDAAGSALGAPAGGAGAAAYRGADDRVLRACADARSRRSCAAVG